MALADLHVVAASRRGIVVWVKTMAIAIAFTATTLVNQSAKAFDMNAFRAYAERARTADGSPGVSIAIVTTDGRERVIPLGVRSVDTGTPVDPDTIFSIGSLTKAFTAATLATTLDRGEATLEDKVGTWFPELTLYDESLRGRFDLRDMLSGRYGTALSDEVFFRAVTDKTSEYLRYAGRLRPRTEFRDCFTYSNAMYTTSGIVIERVTGKPWGEAMAERIFRPLGMTRSSTDPERLGAEPNRSEHHLPRGPGGAMQVLEWGPHGREAGGASGEVQSTGRDMARWIRMLLEEGKHEGSTVLADKAMREIWRPQTVACPGDGERWAGIAESAGRRVESGGYGLGWYINAYEGRRMIHHSGGQGGFTSYAILIPELAFGVVVMTNGRSNRGYAQAIALRAADMAMGLKPIDWAKALAPAPGGGGGGSIVALAPADRAARRADLAMTATLDTYAGRYSNSVIPEGVTIAIEKDGLVAHLGLMRATLTHWHADTFLLRAEGRMETAWEDLITFQFDGRRRITGLSAQRTRALQEMQRAP